ncbi:protein phosphatase 2C domain-containing protein [uncultured Methanoregula sp.]|uniref:PP2C family protein-serine/threonine phosphatase n=1 Tax=uncultured Methanoregula sp. TaxID=1005933 RepID=UPI002AABCD06|nr:protein phosphatase 2C domain-containing protein [uncultured Methanoregula sp.]
MNLQYHGRSEKGLRENNEDAFLAERVGNFWLFAVADGLGGHMAGEQASAMALKILKGEVEKGITDPKTSLEKTALFIHGEIQRQAETDRNCYGMATTLIAALVDEKGEACIMNIGDSRAYLIGDTVRHTKDQSVVENLIAMGEITREEARHHPLGTMILQALGDPESNIRPDFYEADLRECVLLLSSDGLHDSVEKETIGEIVRGCGDNLALACDRLIEKALESGSEDNVTVVMTQK